MCVPQDRRRSRQGAMLSTGSAEPAHAGGDAVMLCPISDPSESEKDPCPVCAVGGGTEVNVWRGPGVGSVMDPLFKALGHVS